MIETNTIVRTGMKVVTQRGELAQKLGVVARAVSTRASVQILSGVLLRAETGRLHLAATDMELSLRTSFEAQVEDEGSVVVPGRLLVDLARLLPDAEVQLEHSPFADEALRDDEDRDAPAGPDPEVLTPDEAAAPVADPEQPSLVDEAANEPSRPIKRKRASVPSWDEIMFGSPAPKPRE